MVNLSPVPMTGDQTRRWLSVLLLSVVLEAPGRATRLENKQVKGTQIGRKK